MNNLLARQQLFSFSRKFLHTIQSKTGNELLQNNLKQTIDRLFEFHGVWPQKEQEDFVKHMVVIPEFISEKEENSIIEEIEPYIKRLRYEFDHWDDAIHGYRETERKTWYPQNRTILQRVQSVAFTDEIMPYVHILDLAEEGCIKPHVDSTRYCGNVIAGISLLSSAIMRLVRTDEKKYKQTPDKISTGTDKDLEPYRDRPETTLKDNFYVDILLPRRSLYIMKDSSRYNFTHEILSNDFALFKGNAVKKTRRISIICRNQP